MKTSVAFVSCLVLLAISGSCALGLNQEGVNLIKSFEGWVRFPFFCPFASDFSCCDCRSCFSVLAGISSRTHLQTFSPNLFFSRLPIRYKDPVGLPTIGYGHLIKSGEPYRQGIFLLLLLYIFISENHVIGYLTL